MVPVKCVGEWVGGVGGCLPCARKFEHGKSLDTANWSFPIVFNLITARHAYKMICASSSSSSVVLSRPFRCVRAHELVTLLGGWKLARK